MKFSGQFSRMAYIKDYELREIFIKKTKKDKTLEVPCEQCDQKVKRAAIDTGSQTFFWLFKVLIFSILEKDYKWREIYPAVCNVVEMDPLSSCELGEKFDLKKDKDIRLGSQGDFSKSTIKVSFSISRVSPSIFFHSISTAKTTTTPLIHHQSKTVETNTVYS